MRNRKEKNMTFLNTILNFVGENIMEIIMIIAVILGPIIAVLISQKLAITSEKRKEKIFVLKTLLTCRTNKMNYNYVDVINSIDVVFVENKDVRTTCRKLIKIYFEDKGGTDEEKKCLTELIEEITKDLGYKNKITWKDIYEESYYPKWIFSQYQNNQAIVESIVYISKALADKTTAPKQNDTQS